MKVLSPGRTTIFTSSCLLIIDYLVFHGYDAADGGRSKLRIEKISWINGWPVLRRREN
jgi:hypothetical protein